jgi:2-C-methyl-D-erythritol 4-phosphate cytidylyltransferase
VLWHTLRVLCAAPQVEHVWVVLSPEDLWFDRLGTGFAAAARSKLTPLRCGGATRAESVRNALLAMRSEVAADDWVLVHDAVRPCLTLGLVQRLIDELRDDPVGGILAVPIADTIKRGDRGGRIVVTEDRADLWAAQTPQMFRHARLLEALSAGSLAGLTDEASAMERLGERPRLVPGAWANLKITYPQDLAIAALLLQQENIE